MRNLYIIIYLYTDLLIIRTRKAPNQALARKNSREMVQKLIEEDRMKSEGLKARPGGRKQKDRCSRDSWLCVKTPKPW